MSKKIKKVCGNCLLYDNFKGQCKVAVLANGIEYHMPVFPKDSCHMDELGIPVKQVRWWVEDEEGNPTDKHGRVKIEYPEDFFGKKKPE